MLWVVTFSGFLPSLTSSSVVWANPSPGHKPTKVASNQIFFMRTLYTPPAGYVENCFASSLVAFVSPAVSSAPPNGAIFQSFRGIRLSRPPPRRRLSVHFSRAAEALRLVEQPGFPAPVAERSGLRHRNRRQPADRGGSFHFIRGTVRRGGDGWRLLCRAPFDRQPPHRQPWRARGLVFLRLYLFIFSRGRRIQPRPSDEDRNGKNRQRCAIPRSDTCDSFSRRADQERSTALCTRLRDQRGSRHAHRHQRRHAGGHHDGSFGEASARHQGESRPEVPLRCLERLACSRPGCRREDAAAARPERRWHR